MEEHVRVVVATNAFGMGIDKSNVRLVVHYAMSGNLEGYYQEAGRAGRDGNHSRCVLLHSPRDVLTHRFMLDQSHPPPSVMRAVLKVLRTRCRGDAAAAMAPPEIARTAGAIPEAQVEAALRDLEAAGTVMVERIRVAGTSFDTPPLFRISLVDRRAGRLPMSASGEQRKREMRRLHAMEGYAYHRGCRRGYMLRYFGDEAATRRCTDCDNCTHVLMPRTTRPSQSIQTRVHRRVILGL